MSEIVEKIPDFPGFAVKYDTGKNPFFKPICVDNLKILKGCDVGKALLKLIEDASPRERADYPPGVNVMMTPVNVEYTESGYMDLGGQMFEDKSKGGAGCNFWKRRGGSANAAVAPMHSTNGQGTVCKMMFSNAQVLTGKGESTQPFIVLAHELIHSYHCLYGVKIDGKDEEIATTGLSVWAEDRFTENTFRKELGFPLRQEYF